MDYLYRINRVGKYCCSLEFWPIFTIFCFLSAICKCRMPNGPSSTLPPPAPISTVLMDQISRGFFCSTLSPFSS